MVNVRVQEKTRTSYLENPDYLACRKRIEEELADEGRILIRPSGTEPILRIMVEGSNMEAVNRYAMELAEFFKEFDARL